MILRLHALYLALYRIARSFAPDLNDVFEEDDYPC